MTMVVFDYSIMVPVPFAAPLKMKMSILDLKS